MTHLPLRPRHPLPRQRRLHLLAVLSLASLSTWALTALAQS